MAGLNGLISRVRKCLKKCHFLTSERPRSIVYMNQDREILWEDGVEYNSGVLVVPLELSLEEWEAQNIREDKEKQLKEKNRFLLQANGDSNTP